MDHVTLKCHNGSCNTVKCHDGSTVKWHDELMYVTMGNVKMDPRNNANERSMCLKSQSTHL